MAFFNAVGLRVPAVFEGLPTWLTSTMVVTTLVTLVLVVTLDALQLFLALVGAALYAFLHVPRLRERRPRSKVFREVPQEGSAARADAHPRSAGQPGTGPVPRTSDGTRSRRWPLPADARLSHKARRPDDAPVRQRSAVPICAPTFMAADWQGEVDELLVQIAPTPENDKVVKRLASFVEASIRTIIPEAEVTGFASGNFARGTAFGVAVPEVDLVVSVSPAAIMARLESRLAKGEVPAPNLDMRRLTKSAIRACTDLLVSTGDFNFRRSAFRGEEPKVTLLVRPLPGITDNTIPIDFAVNAVTPLYNAALLTECGQIDKRARALVLIVRRWAKDRGICHAAKGNLPPYAWSLLAIYFLQVRGEEADGSLLPPLKGFKVSYGLAGGVSQETSAETRPLPKVEAAESTPATLFMEFMRFYGSVLDWRKEAVSVRLGTRSPADLGLQLHIIIHPEGPSEVGPSIEDPFRPERNLGTSMTSTGLRRMQKEIARANELFAQGASLSALLEPWVPSEQDAADQAAEQGETHSREEGGLQASSRPRAAPQPAQRTLPEGAGSSEASFRPRAAPQPAQRTFPEGVGSSELSDLVQRLAWGAEPAGAAGVAA